MAAIYIHIPFCKKACNYCDFHFSTSLKDKSRLLDCVTKELHTQQHFFADKPAEEQLINSIYFGGGTPSLLSANEIEGFISEIKILHPVADDVEITLEANPDDLTPGKLREIKSSGVNRLSIGIQSFFEEDLKFMNRAHDAQQAKESITNAFEAGFENITIDLIYGTPSLSDEGWIENINKAIDSGVKHISAYALTVEPKTELAAQISTGKINPLSDTKTAGHFEILQEMLEKNGFIHYEISNFCKEGFYSRHNSNYWLKGFYLGVGPSAHSFNGHSRQWNISNNPLYIKAIESNSPFSESENLTLSQKYNEYILTSLRTTWGTSLSYIGNAYSPSLLIHCNKEAKKYILSEHLLLKENKLFLSKKGKLIADKIASDLFYVEDVCND